MFLHNFDFCLKFCIFVISTLIPKKLPSHHIRCNPVIPLLQIPLPSSTLRSAPVGAKQSSPGRLTPCHGYFP